MKSFIKLVMQMLDVWWVTWLLLFFLIVCLADVNEVTHVYILQWRHISWCRTQNLCIFVHFLWWFLIQLFSATFTSIETGPVFLDFFLVVETKGVTIEEQWGLIVFNLLNLNIGKLILLIHFVVVLVRIMTYILDLLRLRLSCLVELRKLLVAEGARLFIQISLRNNTHLVLLVVVQHMVLIFILRI